MQTTQPVSPRAAEFAAEIKKIRRKRTLIITISAICLALLFMIGTPMEIHLPGILHIQHDGLHIAWGISLGVIIFLVTMIAYGNTILYVDKILDEGCDPEKYLAIYSAVGPKNESDPMRQGGMFSAYFYMGRYSEALPYAIRLSSQSGSVHRQSGFFMGAMCGYFMGDAALLKESILRFRAEVAGMKKIPQKHQAQYAARDAMLTVMEGLCDSNRQAVADALPHMKPWAPSASLVAVMETLRGIAAMPSPEGGDRDEALHHFMTVKEKGGSTCFPSIADWYISQLKG